MANDKWVKEYYQKIKKKIDKETINWNLKEIFEKLSIQHLIWKFHFYKLKHYWEKYKLNKAY